MNEIRLGSLFDGIGVFPLAAVRCGIVPAWASEIEKAPISITKRHFPGMAHLGDVTKLNGGDIPPVHIITFGSPCQNLSQIGNRAGLAGEKSSLFFHAIRIIREMREATNGIFPAIAVWENVMGAFFSNDRMDFRAVLSAFTAADISMPASGRWAGAGMVRGHTPDLAWRLMDAQHWASPRLARRQRVFVVADFGGQCSHEILFKPRAVQSISASGGDCWLSAACGDRGSFIEAGRRVPITRPFQCYRILIYGKEMKRGFISQLLRNPIYAQADLDMYEFFKSQGTVVVNEATDFAGTNGCYLYQGRDVQERKNKHLKDQILVLAPSEGLVSSDTWLRCRKKLMANKTFQGGRKAKNTWLAGKVKCGRCGYALMSVGNPTGVQYLRCSKRADSKSCDGCGTLRTREFERFLYGEMVKKLSEFQTLTAKRETVNPKLTALNMELARVEDEIEKLLNTLTGANAVLLSYANSKIEELDTRRQTLTKEIAALSAETMSPEQIERLSVYLNQWEEIDFEDRRQVADGLISQIRATDEHVSIEWKI